MTTLANAQPAINNAALANIVPNMISGVFNLIDSFGRAVAFSRACEAQFNQHGHISPETLNKLAKNV